MLARAVFIGVQTPVFAEFIFGGGYTARTGVFLVQVWICAFTGYTSHWLQITQNSSTLWAFSQGPKKCVFSTMLHWSYCRFSTNNCAFFVVVFFCEAVLKICPCWKQLKKTIKKSTLRSKRLRTVCISMFTALLAQARRTSYLYVNHWTNLCFTKLASNDCC